MPREWICYLRQSAAHSPDFLLFANHPIKAHLEAPPPLQTTHSWLLPTAAGGNETISGNRTPIFLALSSPVVLLLLSPSCACLVVVVVLLLPSDTNTALQRWPLFWPQPSLASPLQTSDLAVCRLDLGLSARPQPNMHSQTPFTG